MTRNKNHSNTRTQKKKKKFGTSKRTWASVNHEIVFLGVGQHHHMASDFMISGICAIFLNAHVQNNYIKLSNLNLRFHMEKA
jgi:hypothetical protein